MYKRGDTIRFVDLVGGTHMGVVSHYNGRFYIVRTDIKYTYEMPIEINGKIVGYKRTQDYIQYFVRPGDILFKVELENETETF